VPAPNSTVSSIGLDGNAPWAQADPGSVATRTSSNSVVRSMEAPRYA
jgi:hypothetical protein